MGLHNIVVEENIDVDGWRNDKWLFICIESSKSSLVHYLLSLPSKTF